MQVGMEEQVLSPCVQDGGEADLATKVLAVPGDRQERLGRGGEEDVEDDFPVAKGQRVEVVGDREDEVEVGHGQEPLEPLCDPLGSGRVLALGAVAIPTGNGELTITCLMESVPFWGVRGWMGVGGGGVRTVRCGY